MNQIKTGTRRVTNIDVDVHKAGVALANQPWAYAEYVSQKRERWHSY